MLARDLVREVVVTVKPNTSVGEVIDYIVAKKVHAVPVLDDAGHIIGMITSTDLLRLCLPEQVQFLDIPLILEGSRIRDEVLEKMAHLEARQIMSESIITADLDMPVGKVVGLMLNNRIDQVPVVQDDRLVGLIHQDDVVRLLVSKEKSRNNEFVES